MMLVLPCPVAPPRGSSPSLCSSPWPVAPPQEEEEQEEQASLVPPPHLRGGSSHPPILQPPSTAPTRRAPARRRNSRRGSSATRRTWRPSLRSRRRKRTDSCAPWPRHFLAGMTNSPFPRN